MSAEPLMVVDGGDAPGVVRAGSEMDYGLVTLGTISEVIDVAGRISSKAPGMSNEELALAVSALAEQVRFLAGEMYQLSSGAMHRRVAVLYGDD